MAKRANGEGTFITLNNGKLLLKVYIGLNSEGKAKYISASGKTKAECKRNLKEKMDALENKSNDLLNLRKESLTSLCKSHLKADMGYK